MGINGITKQQFTAAMSQAYIDALVLRISGAMDAIITSVRNRGSGRRTQTGTSTGVVVDSEVIFFDDVSEADAQAEVTTVTASSTVDGVTAPSALQQAVEDAASRSGLGTEVSVDVSAVESLTSTRTQAVNATEVSASNPNTSTGGGDGGGGGVGIGVIIGVVVGVVVIGLIVYGAVTMCKGRRHNPRPQGGQPVASSQGKPETDGSQASKFGTTNPMAGFASAPNA